MRFFLPESNDLVDPGFDFLNDRYSIEPAQLRQDVYAHEIFPHPPFDGLLVSKSNVPADLEPEIVTAGGIHRYLRLPSSYPILGDCGAFQFIQAEVPPYTCEQIYDYYRNLGFDYGITLDHVIVDFDEAYDQTGSMFPRQPTEDMRRRFRISLDNAREMLRLVKEKGAGFQPIGSAQGWSPLSYREAVQELIEIGYTYIAIGGVAKAKDSVIQSVLSAVRDLVQNTEIKLHVLGVARFSLLKDYARTNVVSCDSAATLMQAFKSTRANYHVPDGQHYTCLRVPPIAGETSLGSSPKVGKILKPMAEALKTTKRQLARDPENQELQRFCQEQQEALDQQLCHLRSLEQKALVSIRGYARGRLPVETAMADLVAYEDLFEDSPALHEEYLRTLKDKPWEHCPCAICRQLGVEVVIMRGNNRNRRRGFHNTYVFYQKFRALVS